MADLEVRYCYVNPHKLTGQFATLLQGLPLSLRHEIISYKQPKDKFLVLSGKLLLRHIMSSRGLQGVLRDIKKNRHGRPYINEDIDFNISHSGNYSICVVSSIGRVGIDIERKREVNIGNFKKHMTQGQWQDIISSRDSLTKFFYYWTLKESVLKADGRGITASLSSVITEGGSAVLEGKQWHVKQIPIDPDYECHIASEYPIGDFISQRVELESLRW